MPASFDNPRTAGDLETSQYGHPEYRLAAEGLDRRLSGGRCRRTAADGNEASPKIAKRRNQSCIARPRLQRPTARRMDWQRSQYDQLITRNPHNPGDIQRNKSSRRTKKKETERQAYENRRKLKKFIIIFMVALIINKCRYLIPSLVNLKWMEFIYRIGYSPVFFFPFFLRLMNIEINLLLYILPVVLSVCLAMLNACQFV